MSNIIGLDEWIIDKNLRKEAILEVDIHLKYPDLNPLYDLTSSERKKRINTELVNNYQKLLESNLIEDFTVIGKKNSPRGVSAKIPIGSLEKLEKLDFIEHIFIKKVINARKREYKPSISFYCVKMTVAIEIEGKTKGMQTIEERFVLIKAKSFEEAYQKVVGQKDSYTDPYLNSKGDLVRWRIESIDDCYVTDITSLTEFNNPEGVEVYSKLKSRRLNDSRVWQGNK